MLGSQGIQPVTLVFNNSKNCFLQLPSNFATHLCLHENQILELSWGVSAPVFLSWIRSSGPEDRVEISRQLGEKLGLKEGEQGYLRPCHQVQSVQQVFVEPLSPDDWEILELHSNVLEQQLLDQIRVVFRDGVFPVWVDQYTVIYIRIASLSPSVPYGRLEQFTELVVSPKLHPGNDQLHQTRSVEPSQHLQHQIVDVTSSSSSFVHREPLSGHLESQNEGIGITDLKSLFRYLFTRGFEPAKENLTVPTIPTILNDCILRTCGTPPSSVSHLGSSHGDVHILPWNLQEQENWNPGQSALTYGRLSKILSPKELRENVKQAMEKKKIRDGPQKGKDAEECKENAVVVRMLCHNVKRLQEDQKFHKCEEIYSGKVWIPRVLQRHLKIEPHSAVRIQPLKSLPRVAEAVMVRPLLPLAESEKEEDIQSAFLNWLHAQSHQPLTCLTGRTNVILLPCAEGKEEFVLTVLKPEQQQDDEMFFLSSSLLKKTDVQIVREPQYSDHSGAGDDNEDLGFPSLSSLGGVEDISRSAFEHISHALMGGSLSRELVSTGRGLRSGALLITGAKGSGKSSLSRALCRKASEELDVHIQVVDCKTLKGKRADKIRQRLEEVFEQAVWRQPSAVLLDDLDHVTGAATSPEHEHGPEAVLRQHIAQSLRDLVDEMVVRSSLIALMVTAQSEHSLHQTLTAVQGSHFFQSFCKIQTPDQAQRVEILRSLIVKKNFLDCPITLDLDSVAKETEGFMPQDLNLLLKRAIHANTLHSRNNGVSEDLSYKDFRQALQGFTPPSLWGAQLQAPTGAGMECIGGLHQARQLLMDIILLPAKYPLLFSSLPMRQCSGVLLFGAPGTGKTLLAGAVAKESGMNFISIKGPELLSKYIGASEQAVRDVFQRAQQAKPCILFFDEFDSLAPRRGHDNTGVTDRVVNQLLTQLDGVEGLTGVYVLAATSRPDLIDPALLRPGRLDKSLYCPPPDREARLEILRALTHSVPLAADVDLEQIAVATELFTGADLKALLYNAQLEAIHSSLGPNLLHDLGSGSDSDFSLSSLIFLNHSSGSDDSAGEGDAALEHSMVLLDPSELPPEDPRHNIWRLYFGSSFESEMDNQSLSELNSQYQSGANSTAPDLTGASMRDPSSCHAPLFMSCLQDGFQELTHEHSERLRAEVSTVKNSYRKNTDESSLVQTGPSKPGALICQTHLTTALANTRASVSREDWRRFTELYESFGASKEGKSQRTASLKAGQRVTLA
ncbi:peroxisome biogenesis factor 1 [Pimephales promelas]|uniref:peroxisome biogenesis factor 1 n=1 Tax=Pimephales promelas TaxID=90988 RepID=UPI001955DA1C|nr:peroxisome biogenesis factor 1 [Pimephales promelas]KAG1947094.1 peroxisome biogenesis factor [Pimephales promelas]